ARRPRRGGDRGAVGARRRGVPAPPGAVPPLLRKVPMPDAPRFRSGLDVVLESGDAPGALPETLRRGRFGLLMNQASVDASFRLVHESLHARFPGRLAALFSPQHGLFAEQQDDMVESGHGHEPQTGAPLFSLYSETRRPKREWLEGLDAFV